MTASGSGPFSVNVVLVTSSLPPPAAQVGSSALTALKVSPVTLTASATAARRQKPELLLIICASPEARLVDLLSDWGGMLLPQCCRHRAHRAGAGLCRFERRRLQLRRGRPPTAQYPTARPLSLRESLAPRRSPVAGSTSMHSASPVPR